MPPVRDEESETQRKAHAKRVRETRRSTQGVTLDEIKSAEQLVKKKQQQNSDPPTTTAPSTQVEYCHQFIGRLCKHTRNIHFYNLAIKQHKSLDRFQFGNRHKNAPHFHTLKTKRHFLPADNIELVANNSLESHTTCKIQNASTSRRKSINPACASREKEPNVIKFGQRMANTIRNYFRREAFLKFANHIRKSIFKSKIFSFKRDKGDTRTKFVSTEILESDSENEFENEDKSEKSKGSSIRLISRIFKMMTSFIISFGLLFLPGS